MHNICLLFQVWKMHKKLIWLQNFIICIYNICTKNTKIEIENSRKVCVKEVFFCTSNNDKMDDYVLRGYVGDVRRFAWCNGNFTSTYTYMYCMYFINWEISVSIFLASRWISQTVLVGGNLNLRRLVIHLINSEMKINQYWLLNWMNLAANGALKELGMYYARDDLSLSTLPNTSCILRPTHVQHTNI